MSTSDTRYSARFQLPDMWEQGRDNLAKCPVYLDGSLVTPTEAGSTVTVYDDDGSAVVSAAAVTVASSIATYTLTQAVVDAADLGEGWVIEWSLLMPDGLTHVFRNDGSIVRRRLYPSITDADIFRREPALDPNGTDPITSTADYQDYLDEVDTEVQLRLIEQGNRPNLIMSPSSLRGVWLYGTLSLIFEALATRLNPAYAEKATHYRAMYDDAWRRLSYIYDEDDDGVSEDPHARRAGYPSMWLTARRSR